jgi:lysozyme
VKRNTFGPIAAAVCSLALLAACSRGNQAGTAAAGDQPDEYYGEPVTGGQCPASSTVQGIDVSMYQGTVNWTKVRASGKRFAVARIGDGYYRDPTFHRNWTHMKSAGLLRGAYQFFEPGDSSITQAQIVVARVGHLHAGDLPVMLDVEATGGKSRATIKAKIERWMKIVTNGTGKKPYIYTGAYFWDEHVGSREWATRPLNVAWYGTNCPGVPNAWAGHHWRFHQYSSHGRVSGISGNVDKDVFNGSLTKLRVFAGI